MEEKRKIYDTILTEGARWLAVLAQNEKNCLIINDDKMDISYKCFLEIARITSNYGIEFYSRAPWYKYFYLKYIKRFKFLKRPPSTSGYYINPASFMDELLDFLSQPLDILYELYNEYYRR